MSLRKLQLVLTARRGQLCKCWWISSWAMLTRFQPMPLIKDGARDVNTGTIHIVFCPISRCYQCPVRAYLLPLHWVSLHTHREANSRKTKKWKWRRQTERCSAWGWIYQWAPGGCWVSEFLKPTQAIEKLSRKMIVCVCLRILDFTLPMLSVQNVKKNENGPQINLRIFQLHQWYVILVHSIFHFNFTVKSQTHCKNRA